MTLEEIQLITRREIQSVELLIQSTLDKVENSEAQKWMRYFCSKGGHRLRPMLTVLAYRVFTESESKTEYEKLIKLATVLELLHSASLIHDDVIDMEEERREQVALQNLVGNKNAILIGNIFYLKAFEIASTLPNLTYFNEMISTSMAMCFGEINQSMRLGEGNTLTSDEYVEVVQNKTGQLISSCCYSGALLSGASKINCDLLGELGLILGTLYQMRDDLKDCDANISKEVNVQKLYLERVCEFKSKISKLDGTNKFVQMLEAFFTILTKNIK